MNEQMLNMLMNRIEEIGYKLGGEAVQLLQQYYPLVRRKIMINDILWLSGGIVLLFISVILFWLAYKELKSDDWNDGVFDFGIFAFAFMSIGGFLFISSIVELLNLDYYTIHRIIEQISNFR